MKAPAWLVALAALAVAGCVSPPADRLSPQVPPPSPPAGAGKMLVIASFYTLYEFAARIAGDHAEVRSLVPAGAAPHDYEPTAKDVAALSRARLLVYNRAGFEPWVDRLLPGLPASLVRVQATEGLPLVKGEGEHDTREPVGVTKDANEEKTGLDPHVWLDPVLAQRQVDNILAGFVTADPDRRAAYEANASRLRADLAALHQRLGAALGACRTRTFITSHAAFGYLARRYGLTMVPITGLSPVAEPAPARMREVVKQARAHGIGVIFFETLVSPKVAEALAREVGATTLVLNPVEGLAADEQARGATYFTVMDDNLRHLVQGLVCR